MMNSLKPVLVASIVALGILAGPASAADIFRDDFSDVNLESRWDVKRKSPDNMAVEDGALLLLSSKFQRDDKDELQNILTPKVGSLEGDWTMNVKFSGEFQTALEELSFGITNGPTLGLEDVWASVGTRGDKYYGWAIYLAAGRQKDGQAFSFQRDLLKMGCNVCGPDRMFPEFAKTIPQPITAKFQKMGHQYLASVRLGGDDQPWTVIERITAINASGKPFLVLRQKGEVTGETLVKIDDFSIEGN
jgi:hypothetical protein